MKNVFVVFAVVALLYGCAGMGMVDRAKRDINPLIGGTTSEVVWVSTSDEKDPYILRFGLEFGKPIKADAFWTYEETNKLIRDGIAIHDMDRLGYVKLVTLDMKEVKKKTGSFATPIELNLGYNNPISGYPVFNRVKIHENKNIPKEERHKCFEATCLEIVVMKWNEAKKEYIEGYVTPHRSLNQ